MNELKALEMITTAGYSVKSNYTTVIEFMKRRKDVAIKDIVPFFKNTYAQKHGINKHHVSLAFFRGTIAGQSALLFSKYVKERYYEGWVLKVSVEGCKITVAKREEASLKREETKQKAEIAIQERIEEAVNKALATNVVKELATIEAENNMVERLEKLKEKGIKIRRRKTA